MPTSHPGSKTATADLLQLQNYLGLVAPSPVKEDTVFIAVDVENGQNILRETPRLDLRAQIGIAVLDTRDFHHHPLQLEDLISTQELVMGAPVYLHNDQHSFIFGDVDTSTLEGFGEFLRAIFARYAGRRIALVGHGMVQDLDIMEHYGLDLSRVTMFDTSCLAVAALDRFNTPPTLQALLIELDCTYGGLHHAGNDANFALRCLLILAAWDCKSTERGRFVLSVARTSLPAKFKNVTQGRRSIKPQSRGQRRSLTEGEYTHSLDELRFMMDPESIKQRQVEHEAELQALLEIPKPSRYPRPGICLELLFWDELPDGANGADDDTNGFWIFEVD